MRASPKTWDRAEPSVSDEVQGYSLDLSRPMRRQPPRPLAMRDANYLPRFDDETLFYDAILGPDETMVRLLSPKLLNLRPSVASARFTAEPHGTVCDFTIRDLDRQDQLMVRVPPGTTTLFFSSEIGCFPIPLRRADTAFLSGERVVLTVQKDNRLQWIRDWAQFYQEIHGATAFCIYDNGSTRYSLDALRDAVGVACPGAKVLVVRWPFKFGPVGVGKKKYWDSDFCKLGAMEHARWSFLQNARSVLNCDIDELLLCKHNKSVFEQAETAWLGVVSFYGDWIVGVDGLTRTDQDAEKLSFADFAVALRPPPASRFGFVGRSATRCAPKWALVPSRCPPNAQWHVHKVAGWPVSRLIDRRLNFRHFREISTSWKYARTGRPTFDPAVHVEDTELLAAFRHLRWLEA